jgi:hypothetical protein
MVVQPRMSMNNATDNTTETSNEPRHPSRFEKKTNT